MDPKLWEMLEEGESEDEVAAILRLGQSGIVPHGVRVIAQFGEILTVRMRRGSILNIRENAEVMSFKAPGPPMGPDMELDDTELFEGLSEVPLPSDERRPPSLDATGRGVIVGFVDWGLDFAHPDFRNPDGSTRILALWDQQGHPRPESPQPYGYGVVHTRDEINHALTTSDPYATLHYHPADSDVGSGSHGTLVASIAAGNGHPLGIAPEAELVFVHFATWGQQDRSAKLGNSVTLLEAIDFVARTAGERPWVINLSMGRTGEQHDGTTLSEQGLDAVLRAAPGHVICQSTGNYYTRRLHASGQLRPAEERRLVWEVPKGDVTPHELEIWYPGRDKMEVEIRSPDGKVLALLKLGERVPLIVNGVTVGRAYHRDTEPNNLDNHIDIFLYTGSSHGAWEVTLIATNVVDGRFHAWIERNASCPNCQSHFRSEDADPTSTTGTICNGLRTIAVGAYNAHQPDLPVASFSSMGPTRDSRLKPDLCAPGVSILGARSAPRDAHGEPPLLTRMSGTSFAVPHVTGCVALMLQVAPRPLRIEEVHNLLLANVHKVSFPEELPSRVGGGYLDIESAVEAARNIGHIGPKLSPASVAKEVVIMREDQESEISEFVEGKAGEEADAEVASGWQNTFHRITSDITSEFEGGKANTLNLYDRGVISYGKHQATLASGTLYPILKRYTELSSSRTARKMTAYLDRVKQRDESLREDTDFIQLLKDAAKEPEMNRAQDEEFARQYWEPSKKAAREAGIKSALGYFILYDTRVQGGMQQVLKKTQELLGGKVGDVVKTKEITEQEFLRVFVEERVNRNLRISVYQSKQAEELNKEADALDAQAIATDDPQHAKELKFQAAEKRKKAKQNAANAAALKISATKTRGPSLRALVASGDLNLYGDTDGKIYLTGKPGVVIAGLKLGAMVDSTTPAEQVAEEADEEAVTKRNFGLISGGPGPYDNRYIEHDQSWANYVTPVLLLERDTVDFVELADQVVAERAVARTSTAVLHHVLSRADMGEVLTLPGRKRLLSAAEIFDAFAYPGREGLRSHLDQHFEVVAPPRAPIDGNLRAGDLLIRRGEGGLGHLSVIASRELWNNEQVLSEGLMPETFSPGKYAQVVEMGMRPHVLSDTFARRVADPAGRLPYDQLVLRPREHVRQRIFESIEIDESVIIPDLVESFSGQVYTTGWTTFMPFELNGKPHYLAYKILTGDVSIDRIRPGAREDPATHWPVDVVHAEKWSLGWTTLMPFKLAGSTRTHYLAYKALSGDVSIDRIKSDGKGVDTIWGTSLDPSHKWTLGWTHFMPFTLDGKPHYLAYKEATGEVTVDRIKADGKGVSTIWGTPLDSSIQWTTGWTTFMPFKLPSSSRTHYLAYKVSIGDVTIDRIKPDGKGIDTIWGTPLDSTVKWTVGWTHFMPFTLDGKPHYLAYKGATGEIAIDRIKPDGKGVDMIWGTPLDASLKWAPDWTTIMPFKMDGKPHYFAYNANNGWVSVGSIAEELHRCVSPGVSRDDPTALNLSSIGTDDFNVTLTVRGTSYQVKGNVFYPGQSNGTRVLFNISAVPGGKAPIVFIAHGNHSLFHNPANRLDERGTNPGGFLPIFNHKGYEYFQQLLAQMGIISVSVDCNQFSGPIGPSPTNIQNRADLVLGAVKHFQSLNSGSDPTFGGHIDFSRVGLMGHSRGGEVVLLVPELLALSSTGISGVTVKGVVSIAPTDVGATTGKPTGFAFMTILPAADLDVITNDGAKFYDQASADPFKCQLYIHDANHNYFNTEWVSDDRRRWNLSTSSLSTLRSSINVMDKNDAKAILKGYGCAFLRAVLLGHNLSKFLEGREIPPGVARFRDVHLSFERTGSTTVDDNEDHDINRNTLGKPNSKSGGLTANEYDFVHVSANVFNNTFYGNTRGMVAQSGTSGRFRWDLGGSTDLTGREVRIRTAEVYNGTSVPAVATGFKLGLVDAAAKQAFVDSDDVGGLPRPYDRRVDDLSIFGDDFTKTMLTTLRFPVSCLKRAEPGFDPKQVRAIILFMDRHDGRALAFDQLQIV